MTLNVSLLLLAMPVDKTTQNNRRIV